LSPPVESERRPCHPSIDHEILKGLFRRAIKDCRFLAVLDAVVNGSNDQDPAPAWFPGDDLFTPATHRRGLPIGNLTSQWFANWYLTGFDHALTAGLRSGGYVRYCDDFVLLGDDRGHLLDLRHRAADLLAGLRLRLHPGKTAIVPARAGVTFVGYRTWPHRRTVRGANIRAFRARVRRLKADLTAGWIGREEYTRRVSGWLGHAAQADDPVLMDRVLNSSPGGHPSAGSPHSPRRTRAGRELMLRRVPTKAPGGRLEAGGHGKLPELPARDLGHAQVKRLGNLNLARRLLVSDPLPLQVRIVLEEGVDVGVGGAADERPGRNAHELHARGWADERVAPHCQHRAAGQVCQ
jgi:hypothetical protein